MSYHVHCCDEVDQESVEADAVERWLQSPEAEERLAAALAVANVPAARILQALRDSTPNPMSQNLNVTKHPPTTLSK